jgi:hypothetical protein
MSTQNHDPDRAKRSTIFPGALDAANAEPPAPNNPEHRPVDGEASNQQVKPIIPQKRSASGEIDPSTGNAVSKRVRAPPQPEKFRVRYEEFEDCKRSAQDASITIACDNTSDYNIVAIRRLKGVEKSTAARVRNFTSDQVVSIRETFFNSGDFVIIYEYMEITLRKVTSVLVSPLQHYQIAAIMKEVRSTVALPYLLLMGR